MSDTGSEIQISCSLLTYDTEVPQMRVCVYESKSYKISGTKWVVEILL